MAENMKDTGDREIVLTEQAARRIAILRDQEQAENTFLRISVSGGGCSGFQYALALDEPKAEDAPSDLAIIGRYVLTPDLFEILAETRADKRGEIQLTDGLRTLRKKRPMYAVEFEGKRYDTGDKLGFLKATVEFALARPDLADAFRTYLKTLRL